MQWRDGTTVINTVRATSTETEVVRLRLRLSNLLEMVEFRPASLAPASILCIRSLDDPLPEQLLIDSVRPATRWEQAVRNQIDKLVRQAERPSYGAVSSEAQAVLFVDRAELMACLARDWYTGKALNRWWWRGLLRNRSIEEALLQTWLDTIEFVPHALEKLSKIGDIIRFVDKLKPADSTRLTDGVLKAYQLVTLRQALSAPITAGEIEHVFDIEGRYAPDDNFGASELRGEDAANLAGTTPFQRHVPSPPWTPIVPESTVYHAYHPAQTLLGIALTIVRAPSIIYSSSFTEQARYWVVSVEQKKIQPDIDDPPEEVTFDPEISIQKITSHTSDIPVEIAPILEESGQLNSNEQPDDLDPQSVEQSDISYRESTSEPETRTQNPLANPSDRFHMEQSYTYENGLEPMHTRLGGVFYLVNVGLYLELYGDASQPELTRFALNIWNFVMLVSTTILGERHQDDPVWQLLASLAERDVSAAPDHDFVPPDNWRMPPEWLISIPDAGKWSIHRDESKLQVWHPLGFCVADDHDLSLQQCLDLYTIERFETKLHPRRTYLECLTDYVRIRLQLALENPLDLAQRLFICDARIYSTDTHLDIVFQLESLPIEVRLAGLDRDPGWIPSAGKFIRFHFE